MSSDGCKRAQPTVADLLRRPPADGAFARPPAAGRGLLAVRDRIACDLAAARGPRNAVRTQVDAIAGRFPRTGSRLRRIAVAAATRVEQRR